MQPSENLYCFSTLEEWLHTLETRHVQEIQLGLDRIRQVATRLDLLKPEATVITVGGTNGKGSTVAALEAIYTTAGYRVACYTSPHLYRFNDRIRVNQKPIHDQQLMDAFATIEEARQAVDLTYFEVSTLAALCHFKQHALDLIILEVGLGGRLDATNLIDSDLAIITTIDFDHQALLGTTREAIGYEKAGILRQNRPFIFADNNPPQSILTAAKKLSCPGFFYGHDYDYRENTDPSHHLVFSTTHALNSAPTQNVQQASSMVPLSPLTAPSAAVRVHSPMLHRKAIAAAIQATFLLNEALPVKAHHIEESLEGFQLSGRLEWIPGQITTLLDVAHNPQAAQHLSSYLHEQHWRGKIHVVFSALADKDLPGLIEPLLPLAHAWYPACLNGKRAASLEQLTEVFKTYGIIDFCFENPRAAYECAYRHATIGDLILVYGSFYTIADVQPTICKIKASNR